jgi:uncharacterized membrane protein
MPVRDHIANLSTSISLAIAAALGFLAPFDAARNVDLQGLLLVISGGFAWGALLVGSRKIFKSINRSTALLLMIFAISCVVSLLVNPHFIYDLLGAPYIRLGTAGLLACIGIGLLAASIKPRRLLGGLYWLILALAVVSLPYYWLHFHNFVRIGGLFEQADVSRLRICPRPWHDKTIPTSSKISVSHPGLLSVITITD